ncbi:proline--tRNA ligase [Candidatus Caldatribacterium saccharofermentans]|uniref:Proline--tRNA ligase n=1 Tax=Candidatus Caldatribacterium saccharofermentans TaxID=1454753 RepID=A0A7V4TFQ8_9BACT
MRMSLLFAPTMKEDPQEAEVASHRLMLRGGFIRQLSAGVYTFLPLGWRTLEKIIRIVREEMNRAGGQELLMPAMQPAELWKETGRWDLYGPELVRFQDRRGRDFCLGPTHEEVITDLARREIRSYRQLPLMLYQIQTKFRDEIRPRFGIMRAREFIMKDLYSFDRDVEGLRVSYQKMYEAYCRVFSRCGLRYIAVPAESGVIGGDVSHEFLILAESGEEKVFVCPSCNSATTVEEALCPQCGGFLEEKRGIEVGHIFQLGTKYSEPMKAYFVDRDGKEKPLVMGCYGIGIGRTMAAAIEANHDEKGICWPISLAPYEVVVIPVNMKKEGHRQAAEELYGKLRQSGFEVVIDDREESAGYKFTEADLIGFPLHIIVGERMERNGRVEVKLRKTHERFEVQKDDVCELLEKIRKELLG